MKKSVFVFVSLVLAFVMAFSSFAVAAVGDAEKSETAVWSEEVPFVRYEDRQGIRYKGPTGDTLRSQENKDTVASAEENDYVSESSRDKSQLAAVGNTPLPESVDLSQSKYFPPIGNQGGLGSCATFSTAYYQLSYEINRSRDVAATLENTRSPQIVYNLMRTDDTSGTYSEDNYKFLMFHGAPSMAMLPYSDSNSLDWHAKEEIWNEAMDCRVDEFFSFDEIGGAETQVTSPDDEDLRAVKEALASGKVLIYSTFIYSWVADKIKAHPDAPENSKFAGQEIVKYQDGFNGGHSMTLVGYNDKIWVDQNGNNKVDSGEMGAFKIANSWGDGYANGGFCWVAYDALNKETSVDGGYSGVRGMALEYIKSITVKPYAQGSKIYARFTMSTTDRVQMNVDFNAERNGLSETARFLRSASYRNENGRLGFDGTLNATDGTFCFALDNVSPMLCNENFEEYVFSATFEDTDADGKALEIKNVEIVNEYTGMVYKCSSAPFKLDGEKRTVVIKDAKTDDKTIFYIGYDEPTLHYKSSNGDFKSVEMEYCESRLGYNYRYVIEDTKEDLLIYFTDKNGRTDNNGGNYYKAVERLNFYRTEGAGEPLEVSGFEYTNGLPDINKRSYFAPFVTGGFEPYVFSYTVENLETGKVSLYDYDYRYDKSHAFYTAGKYKFTIGVRDQSGDIATYTEILDIIDRPFVFVEFTADTEATLSPLVGDNIHFYARTDFESIISRGPFKSLYEFIVKDSQGNVCYTEVKKSDTFHLGDRVSHISLDWIPSEKGNYTISVSSTDDKKDYAEISLEFTVFDKVYGDADTDGKINIKDATLIQLYCASLISEEDYFSNQLADNDGSGTVNITDATRIRKFLANLSSTGFVGDVIEYIPPVTEPEPETTTQAVTEPEVNQVTFTNSHRWSGDLYCYYWSNENTNLTSWPGEKMNLSGTNEYNEQFYTFDVPDEAAFIIFTNGSYQTVDISYLGGIERFYPLNETDSSGHYKVANW